MRVDLLPKPPEWTIDANCADIGPGIFFTDKGQNVTDAKKVCARCSVITECLEFALDLEASDDTHRSRHGVYGGLSPRERAALARTRKDTAA